MPRTTLPTKIPIKPQHLPIVPSIERWKIVKDDVGGSQLYKIFQFNEIRKVKEFTSALFDQMNNIQHNAEISIKHDDHNTYVIVSVWTRNINSVTNIDKEFAAFCDIIFHDVSYNFS